MKHQPLASVNIEQKTLIVFGFVLAVIIAVCALFYYTTIRFIENSRWVEHTHQVLHETEEAFSKLKDAERGTRGYIITGDERFLLPYTNSVDEVEKHFAEVRRLTADNPAQQQRLDYLEPLIKRRLELLGEIISLRRENDFARAQEITASGVGDGIMNSIHNTIGEMKAEEHRLLQERTENLQASQRSTFFSLAFITLLFVVFFCVFYWLIKRDLFQRKHVEIKLKRESDFVSGIFENSRALGIVLDKEGRIVRFNKSCEQTSGYTFEEVKGKAFWDVLLPSNEKEKIQTIFLHLRAEDYPTSHENYWLTKNGEPRLLSWSNSAMLGADGEVEFIICTGVDITERKMAQDALLESESRYRLLFDSNPHSAWVYDLKTLEILAVNDAAIRKYGYSKAEFLSMSLKDLRSPEDMPEFLQNIKRAATGVNEVHTSRHLKKDGSFIEVEVNAHSLIYKNKLSRLVVATDITESKRTENELRALFAAMSDLILVIDKDGRYLKVAETNTSLLYKASEEIIGKTVFEVFSPSEAGNFLKYIHLALETNATQQLEYALPINGVETHFIGTVTPMTADTVLFVARDVTQRRLAENALRESEKQYRSVVDNVKEIIFQTNARGGWTFLNKAWTEVTGFSIEESLGKNFLKYIHPDDRKRNIELFRPLIQRQQDYCRHEIRYVTKDGGFRWIEVFVCLTLDAEGNIIGTSGTLNDITERRMTEIALRASERRNRDLIDKSLGMISTHDLDGNLLSVNQAAAKTLGYEPEDVLGMPLKNLIAPSVRHLFDVYLQEMREKGESSGLMLLVTKSGEERTFAYHNTTYTEEGKPPFVLGHAQDITQMRRAEAEKSLAQRRLQFHLENSRIALIEYSKDWSVLSWSSGAEKIFGWKASEVVGKRLPENFKFVFEDDAPFVSNILADLSNGIRMEKPVYNRNYTKDGAVVSCEWFCSAQCDSEGEITSFMSLAHDITEYQQMQIELREARDAALESARLKSEFLANMSHEIRTPMNGVIGMSDLLFSTNLNEEQREYAETIRTSAFSLLTIINDILDFSKIEAGKLHFETIDFDLLNTVESTVELFAEQAQSKRLEIASLVEANVPIGLRGDPGRLRQVLTNLVGNAVKFTEKGEVVVHVRKESETENAVMLRFSIRDTGIGIKEEAQKYLFQAFMQADGSTTRKYGGTGLGLAITKQLVELMDGRLNVESDFGRGSIFSFTAQFEKQPAAKVKKRKQRTDLKDLRVLVVDDNATNRKILVHQVSSWGMAVADAESGKIALEKLRAAEGDGQPFDLAILDLMMPEMDGFELARRIKKDESISGTRLILMPSFGTRGHGSEARETGISGYLIKPVRQSDLFDCITTVMGDEDFKPNAEATELVTRHTIEEKRFEEQRRILVAEDNLVNQKVIRGQLERLGYRADLVDNGRKALAALEKRSYSLVLMDCQMPEMDGYAATKEIRRRESGARRTPVVAVTANAMQGEREKCIAAGMDDYISKPLKIDNLKEVVSRWLAQAPAENTSPTTEENGKHNKTGINDLVDLECLQEVTDGDAEMLKQIVTLYIEQTSEQLNDLVAAVSQNNGAEVYRLAHKSLGSSSTCGMKAMVQPLKELEQMGREENLAEAGNKLTEIRQCFQRLEEFLKQYLKQTV